MYSYLEMYETLVCIFNCCYLNRKDTLMSPQIELGQLSHISVSA